MFHRRTTYCIEEIGTVRNKCCIEDRVWSRLVLGRLRLQEFFIRSWLWLLVKENIILEFFKTDYELSKIRSNTCTSTCRSYFMFTLEKTSNDIKFHVFFRELLKKYSRWSRAKVTAPAPAKYPSSEILIEEMFHRRTVALKK